MSNQCIQSMYLRPSGDTTGPYDKSAILVLETDLAMKPGQACKDKRLGDLLVELDDLVEMASPGRTQIESVEIVCMPVGKGVETTYRAMRAS